ncbi:MAG: hypothetical protein AAGL89_15590 [Pseudomonadota bacterium]
MSSEFDKHLIPDMAQKLSHLEGVLGAYLPSHVFTSGEQIRVIDGTKYALSRLRSGERRAANWELGRLAELFSLPKYGLDYRLFLRPYDEFEAALSAAAVGSYGATAALRLREELFNRCDPNAEITITRDARLGPGGIGHQDSLDGLIVLTHRDKISLNIPLLGSNSGSDHVLLLNDFPDMRVMTCLMPSIYAPENGVRGDRLRVPTHESGYDKLPVGGKPGYMRLYAVQTSTDLAAYLGLHDAEHQLMDLDSEQTARLMDFVLNSTEFSDGKARIGCTEYLLQ